jgi:ABC-type dipeptide/oligopeptide/nickel transport system permease subunit
MLAWRVLRDTWVQRTLAQRVALIGLAAVVLLGLLLAPFELGLPTPDRGVDLVAPLGRDHLGRNALVRLLAGCSAVTLPFAVALLSGAATVVLVAPASWWGGLPRLVVGAAMGVVGAIPRFVWALLALSIYGRSPVVLGVAAGLAFSPAIHAALDVRIAGWRTDPGVLAELAHGVPRPSVLWEHLVVWRCGPALVRLGIGLFGYVVALEATLAYLGFAVGEPTPSWGNAIAFDWGRVDVAPSVWIAPAVLVAAVCAAAMFAAHEQHGVGR